MPAVAQGKKKKKPTRTERTVTVSYDGTQPRAPYASSTIASGSKEAGADATLWLGGRRCGRVLIAGGGSQVLETCPGVRPGAIVKIGEGTCTFNFVFTGYRLNDRGRRVKAGRFIGTAGHCIISGGEKTWGRDKGPRALDSEDHRIGEFSYAVLEDPKDFALIRLDKGVKANPQMCHFGGPTGTNSDLSTEPTELQHYGNGVGVGDVVPARESQAVFGMPDPDHVYAQGVAAFGDSGSGVMSAGGRAVGVLVRVGVMVTSGPEAGDIEITRLAPQVARAEKKLGLTELRLIKAAKLETDG